MAIGLILINAALAREHEIYNKLSKDPKIIEVYPLFGEYNLIAIIEADDFDKIG